MSTPLISILIPAYNVEKYLPHCLHSILSQSYKCLQIVIIDDGSTDNTLSVCARYADKDTRVEVYHQDNSGVATTRNNLLEKVKGDWVLFVDADDWIEPDMVDSLINLADERSADIVECKNVINDIECNKERQEITIWKQEDAVRQFLRHVDFNGSLCNKLVKASLLHKEKFQRDISYGEDALFCWHLLQKARTIVRTSAQFYHYRMNEESISHLSWTPEKKGSGSIVWRIISQETAELWPQYLDIAKARFAIEDMWGLYYASLANYPYDDHIHSRQLNVRNNLRLIRNSGLVSINKIVTCYALAYCYPLGRLLKYTR